MFIKLHEKPGYHKLNRETMLNESRRRRMILVFAFLILVALMFGIVHPCPGGVGQY